MTQRQACREALRRTAEKRMPKSFTSADDDVEMSTPPPSQDGDQLDIDSPLFDHDNPPEIEMDSHENPAGQAGDNSHQNNRKARVEEVEDEEAGVQNRWVEDYPGDAGKAGE